MTFTFATLVTEVNNIGQAFGDGGVQKRFGSMNIPFVAQSLNRLMALFYNFYWDMVAHSLKLAPSFKVINTKQFAQKLLFLNTEPLWGKMYKFELRRVQGNNILQR